MGEAYAKDDQVLIIDDDPSVRDFLKRFLQQKGFSDVRVAADGAAGLAAVRASGVRLVLLDIKLPDQDGVEVLRQIKKEKPATGVIMITGHPDESIAKRAIGEGAFDYIIKPFDLKYLEMSVLTKLIMMS